jgi:carbonic anhydrase
MPERRKLLENNRRWASAAKQQDPAYFERLAAQQRPAFLWIGCSDSRVPANVIVGLEPGEVFVHRNVANVVVHSDLNCLSVVQFAVEVLEVRHIIVCGHYGCAGVTLAMADGQHGLIDNWLRHIKDVYRAHEPELAGIDDRAKRVDRLAELHVQQQVANVAATTFVQNAWARGARLIVSGWIYRIEDGLLRDLDVSIDGPDRLEAIFRVRPRDPG